MISRQRTSRRSSSTRGHAAPEPLPPSATDRPGHREGARPRTLLAALLVAPLLWLAGSTLVHATEDERGYGVVIRGAHLLDTDDYRRVAYLPVGTIVELTGDKRDITVNKRPRPFASIVSQSGARGFLRTSLFRMIGDEQTAVPVSSTELPLFAQPYSQAAIEDIISAEGDPVCDDRCILFSRTGGIYLTINGTIDDYYEVTLNRTLTKVQGGSDLERQEERYYLEKVLVNTGGVKLIDRSTAEMSMTSWRSEEKPTMAIDPAIVAEILDRVKGGADIKESTIWCNSQVDATGQVKFNLFIAEAGVQGSITTKEKGQFRMSERYSWQRNDQTIAYDLYRDIECKRSEPERMLKLTLQGRRGDDSKRAIRVDLDRFKSRSCRSSGGKGCSDWIFLKEEGDDYEKMVIVNDWPSYDAILRQLEKATGDPISPEYVEYSDDPLKVQEIQKGIIDRQNLYDFILRQIAIFQDP